MHPPLHLYRITIVMPGGSRGRCTALHTSACAAIVQSLADFPRARAVVARPISAAPSAAPSAQEAA